VQGGEQDQLGCEAVVPLVDESRGRDLPTTLYLPEVRPAPLVVFAHGWTGHPRKFTRLFRAWAGAGIAVAAPTFPRTNDESPLPLAMEDVANQPADVSFVLDRLLADEPFDGLFDRGRLGVAGYSLGSETVLAVAFHDAHRDDRFRAVVALGGSFAPEFGKDGWHMRTLPLLLVLGADDRPRRVAAADAVFAAARAPKLRLTLPDTGHDICQDSSPVLDDVIAATTTFWRLHLLGDETARDRLLAVTSA
jgi:predicted dienelactone hydrolase